MYLVNLSTYKLSRFTILFGKSIYKELLNKASHSAEKLATIIIKFGEML